MNFAPILASALLFIAGCSRESTGRMSKPADPEGEHKALIALARKTLAQNESWADSAEFEVVRRGSKWHVTAWRVEHPEAKGAQRYVPWGSRTIVIDERGVTVEFLPR